MRESSINKSSKNIDWGEAGYSLRCRHLKEDFCTLPPSRERTSLFGANANQLACRASDCPECEAFATKHKHRDTRSRNRETGYCYAERLIGGRSASVLGWPSAPRYARYRESRHPRFRFVPAVCGTACASRRCCRQLPDKQKHRPNWSVSLFGGGSWIRTSEVSDNRFTVCPLWPLGNSPIYEPDM